MRNSKDSYIAQVTAAFAEFANAHHGEKFSKSAIEEEVKQHIKDGSLHGYSVSDFTKKETSHHRSRNSPTLFERLEKGYYIVL